VPLPTGRMPAATSLPAPEVRGQAAGPHPLGVHATRVLRAAYPLQRAVYRVHDWLYRRTDGRVGRLFARRPCLVLTTTGRRSGRPRTVVLVYVLDGDRWVVVGSNLGSRRPPAWLLNLQDAPDATVTIAGRRTSVRATVASPEERERLWPIVDRRNYGQYGRYQAVADRTILLVILEPVAG